MATEEFRININGEELACALDYTKENRIPSVISLHGGGPSDRNCTKYLSELFLNQNRSVLRLDFSGHGGSTGTVKKSSLIKRFNEASGIMRHFGMSGGITVIGSSMGGYIASKLTEAFDVRDLILFCPAAYSVRAWSVPFDSGFTEIIRSEKSYLDSDLEDVLNRFSGRSLFFIGNKDDVIPEEVVRQYERGLVNCRWFKKIIIDNCPHPIHHWSIDYPDVRKMIIDELRRVFPSDEALQKRAAE